MIPLAIVERELRVAARKRSTFYIRLAGALVALVIAAGVLLLTTVGFAASGTGSLGRGMFATLSWLSLAVALGSGLFLTADCLSEEKREGTLGFLFLTDLRGFDVVLGKLLATSLRGFYALLGVFPILGITLVLGGVTGEQFWKTILALVSALFVSLAAGLFVSALSRDSKNALAATLLLLLLLGAGGPAADAIVANVQAAAFDPVLSLSSPVYLFRTASAWGRTPFWLGLLVNQGIGWTLFGLTCVLIPRTWQERAGSKAGWAQRWRFHPPNQRAALRRRLLGVNPVLWLSCRERWQSITVWGVTVVSVAGFLATWASERSSLGYAGWMAWSSIQGLAILVLYLGVAAQAGRLFVDGRRNGLLELLLVTPLPVRQIVYGHWRALVRMIWLPLALCLAVQMAGALRAQQTLQRISSSTAAPPAPVPGATTTNVTGATTNSSGVVQVRTSFAWRGGLTASAAGPVGLAEQLASVLITVAASLATVANLVALTWFGMWTGLNSRTTSLSTLKTLIFVQIVPWFAISFLSALTLPLLLIPRLGLSGAGPSAQWMTWYVPITAGVATMLVLAKDLGFVVWARRRLLAQFRDKVAAIATPTLHALPPRARQPGIPPILPPPALPPAP